MSTHIADANGSFREASEYASRATNPAGNPSRNLALAVMHLADGLIALTDPIETTAESTHPMGEWSPTAHKEWCRENGYTDWHAWVHSAH